MLSFKKPKQHFNDDELNDECIMSETSNNEEARVKNINNTEEQIDVNADSDNQSEDMEIELNASVRPKRL